MQRSSATIVILLLFYSLLTAQVTLIPERKFRGLSGKVQFLRNEAYSCSGNPLEKPWRVSEVTFDKQGNEIVNISYHPDGSVAQKRSSIYDTNGQLVKWSGYYGTGAGSQSGVNRHGETTYIAGKPVQSIAYKEDSPEWKITYSYDEFGNKIKEVSIEVEYGNTTTRTFKYDRSNRVIDQSNFGDGYNSKTTLEYDSAGNVVKEAQYDNDRHVFSYVRTFNANKPATIAVVGPNGLVMSTTVNTYDSTGNLIRITIDDESIKSQTAIDYYGNGKMRSKDQVTVAKENGKPQHSEASPNPGRILEKYDEKGQQIERYIYEPDGKLYLTQLSSWDQFGRQTRGVETSRTGQYDRDIFYEYDSYGNRVKATCRKTERGEVKFVLGEKWVISYY